MIEPFFQGREKSAIVFCQQSRIWRRKSHTGRRYNEEGGCGAATTRQHGIVGKCAREYSTEFGGGRGGAPTRQPETSREFDWWLMTLALGSWFRMKHFERRSWFKTLAIASTELQGNSWPEADSKFFFLLLLFFFFLNCKEKKKLVSLPKVFFFFFPVGVSWLLRNEVGWQRFLG